MRLEPCDSVFLSLSTATAVIVNRPCIIHNIILCPGTAASAITLYDPTVNTTTTTNATIKVNLHGTANGASISYNGSGSGIAFKNGCIAVVEGTGAHATVCYAMI